MQNKSNSYLIWSDTHLRYKLLLTFLDKHGYQFDKVILLGDYFHNWTDNVDQNIEMARLLKEKFLYDDKYICLLGNHCVSHCYGTNYTYCSGFTKEKHIAVNSFLTRRDWNRFKDYCYINNWLISHAGFNVHIYPYLALGFDAAQLDLQIAKGHKLALNNQRSEIYGAGMSRGGNQIYGGHTWQDFDELTPLPNVRQIIGHSEHKNVMVKYLNKKGRIVKCEYEEFNKLDKWDLPNIVVDLDTCNRHYGVLENGKLSVHLVEENEQNKAMNSIDKVFEEFKQAEIDKLANLTKL